MNKKQPVENIVCAPTITEVFLNPPQGVVHDHEWLYDVGDRLGLRYCQCGKSYGLLIEQVKPDDCVDRLRFKWVEIEEETG